jgi:hypothetical protein
VVRPLRRSCLLIIMATSFLGRNRMALSRVQVLIRCEEPGDGRKKGFLLWDRDNENSKLMRI